MLLDGAEATAKRIMERYIMNKDDVAPEIGTSEEVLSSKYQTMILKESKNGKVLLVYTSEGRTSLIIETIIFEWDNGEPSIQCSSVGFDEPTANCFTNALCDTVPYLRK
jgi:hypothetical protein